MFKGHATALLPSMLAITVLILAAIICPGHDNHVLITLQVCAVPQLPGTHTQKPDLAFKAVPSLALYSIPSCF